MRECGECVVCCVYTSVTEDSVNKPPLTPCPNLVEQRFPELCNEPGKIFEMPLLAPKHYQLNSCNNCTIYDTRPNCCSEYRCAWLNGEGEEEDRPDKCGIVVDHLNNKGRIDNCLIAKPLWYRAENSKQAINSINNISKSSGLPILVLEFTEFKLLRVVGRGV